MIRPFTDSDLPGVVRLLDAVRPHFIVTEQGFRHRLASTPERAEPHRVVADEHGPVVGWATASRNTESTRSDVWWVTVVVDERCRARGLGSALFEEVERHALAHRAGKLLADTTPDDASRRFAERRGFRHTFTRRMSAVDPRDVDVSPLEDLRRRAEGAGLSVLPLAEFADRPEVIFDLDAETAPDVPSDEPPDDLRFDEWLEQYWSNPLVSRDGSFVVADADGRAVSMALLRAHPAGGKALNDFTATRRDHRGRGLARLVKLASIAWAAEHGIQRIFTENDETNAPMLALNTSLGYRPVTAELSWVREPA